MCAVSSKYFTSATDTERIDIDDDNWVDIKSKLSISDHDRMTAKMVELEYVTSSNGTRKRDRNKSPIKANFRPSTQFLLQLAITDWSFKDDAGKKITLDYEHIGLLRADVAIVIEEAIGERNPM